MNTIHEITEKHTRQARLAPSRLARTILAQITGNKDKTESPNGVPPVATASVPAPPVPPSSPGAPAGVPSFGPRYIIAISGKQRAGKDTLAQLLISLLPSFRRVGIADEIKLEYADTLFEPAHYAQFPDGAHDRRSVLAFIDEIKQDPEVRRALIELGRQRRNDDQDYWINRALQQPGDLVIPDVRYQSEISRLQAEEKSGQCRLLLVRIDATREVRAARGTLSNEDDPTETELDQIRFWDFQLLNDIDRLLPRSAHDIAAHVIGDRNRTLRRTWLGPTTRRNDSDKAIPYGDNPRVPADYSLN